ncbi:hypothetical protein WH96_06090 [Kiloniella spongiae]|uniref:Autotransporter domain-containing protein n=1 Tax=Kiloniella spongiae TaxID=1489064 RepID=A0A0H2MHI9_9PROT|nr:autotransporter outer membrane beta-barrel domain-containing protein [Kiloniella spongiae]KLN61853.1 hypothetical protein WH96_06090 [Kiloniella spongiae]
MVQKKKSCTLFFYKTVLITVSALTYISISFSADFTIINGQTETTTQLLSTDGDVGIVEQGGAISTVGNTNYAIRSDANNAIISSSGTLTTTGDNSFGIFSRGTNANVTNAGSISTQGAATYGIVTNNLNTTISNSGSISTTGNIADGILSVGNNTVINNSGSITTTNGNSSGINTTGTNAVINNTGTITTTNGSAHGIFSQGTGATITNAGTIDVTGAGSDAISISGNNTTVVLTTGSNINGDIDFRASTGGKVKLQNVVVPPSTGGGIAVKKVPIAVPNIVGTHTLETAQSIASGDIGNSVLVENNDTIAIISPDIFARADLAITQVAINSDNLVHNHLFQTHMNKDEGTPIGLQIADAEILLSDFPELAEAFERSNEPTTAWVEGFGSYQERPRHNDASFSQTRSGGVLGGIDLPTTERGYTFGVFGGGFIAQLELGEKKFRDIKSNGVIAGGYASTKVNDLNIDIQLTTGISFNESERKVSSDVASADYNSYFISPSLTVSKTTFHEWGVLVPSLTFRYNGQYTESYKETGSIADHNVEDQYSNILGGRAMLKAELNDIQTRNGILKSAVRAGIDGRSTIGDRSTDLTVLGNDITINQKGSDQVIDGIAGLNFSYTLDNGAEFYIDSEIKLGLNNDNTTDNFGTSLRTGLRWNF